MISEKVYNCLRTAYEKIKQDNTYYFFDTEKSTKAEVERIFKWIGGEVADHTWKFPEGIVSVLRKICLMGCIPEQKTHQFYPTKPELAKKAIEWAEIEPGHRVLEPSAGHGGIADFLPSGTICVEIDKINCEVLKSKGHKVHQDDFLEMTPVALRGFDRIVMNPPFADGQAKAHIQHALKFLKPGGILVSVIPNGILKFDEEVIKSTKIASVEYSGVLKDQFDDTKVNVVLIKIKLG